MEKSTIKFLSVLLCMAMLLSFPMISNAEQTAKESFSGTYKQSQSVRNTLLSKRQASNLRSYIYYSLREDEYYSSNYLYDEDIITTGLGELNTLRFSEYESYANNIFFTAEKSGVYIIRALADTNWDSYNYWISAYNVDDDYYSDYDDEYIYKCSLRDVQYGYSSEDYDENENAFIVIYLKKGQSLNIVVESDYHDTYYKESIDDYNIEICVNSWKDGVCEHFWTSYYKDYVKKPTCTSKGYTDYVCNVCGETYRAEYKDALGHNLVIRKEIPATCTKDGKTEGVYCSRCNKVYAPQKTIKAKGHKWKNAYIDYKATAKHTGSKKVVCSVCHKSKFETIPKNTFSVKSKSIKIKQSSLKKKNKSYSVSKLLNIKNAKGKLSYKKLSGTNKISINKSTGKITVSKSLKKGKYKVKVRVSAAGNSDYASSKKSATFTVIVR